MKTKSQILAAAGGDHAAAFDALYTDYAASVTALNDAQAEAEANASDSIRARKIAEAVEPLAEKLGIPLPAKGQKPSEKAVNAMREAVDGAIEGAGGADEALLELLGAYADYTGVDLMGVLEGLDKDADNGAIESAIADAFGHFDALSERAAYADLRDASDTLGLPVDALREYLGDKPLTAREEDVDGEKRLVWGTGADDRFTPLSEQSAVKLLQKAAATPEPEHKPLAGVRQTVAAKESEPKTAAERATELRGQISI